MKFGILERRKKKPGVRRRPLVKTKRKWKRKEREEKKICNTFPRRKVDNVNKNLTQS